MRDIETQDPFQLVGTTIEGKYRITTVVGDGGFGVVYRAVHQGFDEPVAVKCLKLPSKLADKDRDSFLEQLRDEGRLLLRLSRASSGIVQALDVGAFTTREGVWVPYLILEWLEGETLAEHIRFRTQRGDGPFSVAEAVKLLEPAARALAIAHAQKVAHRDVKPQNLFLAQVGSARTMKVLDFGIAKVLADHPTFTQALAATKLGPTAFTPRYGAPEQFNKKRGATGPWTDVFALALIVVEMGSGRQALEGDDPTELYIASADPAIRPTLRARGMKAPEPVERVLAKALSVEPKHRYADAGEFWDALTAAVVESGAAAKEVALGGARGTTPEQTMLSTAEYAAAEKLDVSTDPGGASKGQTELTPGPLPAVIPVTRQATVEAGPALAATVPASPLTGGAGAQPASISSAVTAEAATRIQTTAPMESGAAASDARISVDPNAKTVASEANIAAGAETKSSTTAEAKTAEAKTTEAKTTEAKTAEAKTAEAKTTEAKTTEAKTTEASSATSAPKAAKREIDPMSETPLPERAPAFGESKKAPPPPSDVAVPAKEPAANQRAAAKSAATSAKPSKEPLKKAPAAAAAEPPANVPMASIAAGSKPPWVLIAGGVAALAIAGGLYFALTGTSGGPAKPAASGTPSGRSTGPTASGKPNASGKPSPPTSALPALPSASASAEPIIAPDDMVYIPPGTAHMGEGDSLREVTLTKGFFIDRNEVTVHAYQACMARRMCSAADHVSIPADEEDAGTLGLSSSKEFADTWSSHCNDRRKALDNPINCVDFSNAESFCKWKGKRLPTEAEWERAARGISEREFAWGPAPPDCNRACYDRNGDCRSGSEGSDTCPAGGKAGDRTPDGVFDLGGNVAEWVSDGFTSSPQGGSDPIGDPSATRRVVRGGSLLDTGDKLRATFRAGVAPGTAHVSIGFRCAADLTSQPAPSTSASASASARATASASASARPTASPAGRGK